jgi:uncharacterized protein
VSVLAGGVSVGAAYLTDRGFQYDRRWMLVNEESRFMTQREYPQMALLQADIKEDGVYLFHKNNIHDRVKLPYNSTMKEELSVLVWNDLCKVEFVSRELDRWLSARLNMECRLVFMPDNSIRKVDPQYAVQDTNIANLSDGYPLLLISQSSLDDLNSRLEKPLPMNRFRPNIVITGTNPYEEDEMAEFVIRGVRFFGVKLCARCAITTINQESLEKNKEPLKTLATYRNKNNNTYFGQNVIYNSGGVSLKIGDRIEILARKQGFN